MIGPYTPGYIANHEIAQQLAEVGVILLMFGVGLHFHIKELLAVRPSRFPARSCKAASRRCWARWRAQAFGWGWTAGIVFGIALSVASTVVLVRVFRQPRSAHPDRPHRRRLAGRGGHPDRVRPRAAARDLSPGGRTNGDPVAAVALAP